jgi:hypothetical protein
MNNQPQKKETGCCALKNLSLAGHLIPVSSGKPEGLS